MSDFNVRVNGRNVAVGRGTLVSAAVLQAGETTFRVSRSGEPRGPLCGMGICFECRVSVNGVAHVRSCQLVCEPDMEITTR